MTVQMYLFWNLRMVRERGIFKLIQPTVYGYVRGTGTHQCTLCTFQEN